MPPTDSILGTTYSSPVVYINYLACRTLPYFGAGSAPADTEIKSFLQKIIGELNIERLKDRLLPTLKLYSLMIIAPTRLFVGYRAASKIKYCAMIDKGCMTCTRLAHGRTSSSLEPPQIEEHGIGNHESAIK